MSTKEMLQEVDRRVADGIMEHLLPKAIHIHTIREWENCDCSFCVTKRRATHDIRRIKYPIDFDHSTMFSIYEHDYDHGEIKEFRRESLRNHYRNKLKELCNE